MKPLTKIERVRTRILLKHPFFASLMLSIPMDILAAGESPPGWPYPFPFDTLATNMERIIVSQDFIDKESDDVLVFGVCHELMHIAFEHGIRRGYRDPQAWNIAGDYVINPILKDSGFTLWEKALFDEKYAGMSTEQVYRDVIKNVPKIDPALLDLIPTKAKQAPALERTIKRKVAQAAQTARMYGKMGGGLERFVNEILDPKVPWQVLLRDYMTRITKDQETWSRPNRRFSQGGFILPSRFGQKMGELIGIGDTSGSITDVDLKQYMGEYGAIAEDVSPERIRMIWADTDITNEQVFEDGEPLKPEPKTVTGGTDMRVPLAFVEKYDPEIVVLFTDGYTPWPEAEPPYPLIVCCTTDAPVPIGQVVRI